MHLDSFSKNDKPQIQLFTGAAVASRETAVISPRTPKTPVEDAVVINPTQFAKALQLDEARQKRLAIEANRQHFLLLYVVCASLTLFCIIILLGAAILSGKTHELPTIYRMPVTTCDYSDSVNKTNSSNTHS
ncbi:hypothetical protein MRX96_008104 [Rhipicephalus microplus]